MARKDQETALICPNCGEEIEDLLLPMGGGWVCLSCGVTFKKKK
jgi:predicted RNA-binding Zn-ribbon protein involved in translation (DUF1610 family)